MTDIANQGTRLPGAPDPDLMIPASGGVRVAADLYGERGPLVVLQHGGGHTRHAWKGAGDALAAAGYRAVLTHLAHEFDDGAEQTARPILVGASLGGTTSLLAAGEGVVDARAVVLVDVPPPGTSSSGPTAATGGIGIQDSCAGGATSKGGRPASRPRLGR